METLEYIQEPMYLYVRYGKGFYTPSIDLAICRSTAKRIIKILDGQPQELTIQ